MKRIALITCWIFYATTVLATDTLYKGAIGSQDVNWGTGTFQRRTSTSGTITLDQVNDSKLPLSDQVGHFLSELFGSGHTLSIYPQNITGDNAGYVSSFVNIDRNRIGASAYTDNGYFQDIRTKGPWIDVRAYGATGDGITEDTAAFTLALAIGGIVFVPAGTYVVDNLAISDNTTLIGEGWSSIIKQKSGAYAAANIASGKSNIVIRDIQFKGTVDTDSFQEVYHLLFTSGVTNLLIENVKFSGPRGDALYIGTGNERGQDSTANGHNKNVWVRNCYFDGVSKDNRQGISIIDCDSCWIVNNYFTRLSKSAMPGVIDIEPDSGGTPAGAGSIIRNINILYNKFYDNAGESIIAMNFPNTQSAMTNPVQGIQVVGNDLDTGVYSRTVGIHASCDQTVTDNTTSYDITIRDNRIYYTSSPFYFRGVRGVTVENNQFDWSRYSGWIGHIDGTDGPYDITFTGNKFYRIAYDNTDGGNAVMLYGGKRIAFRNNLFDTCGKQNGTYNAQLVKNTGTMTDLEITGNTFYLPAANANAWDYRVDAGSVTAKTFRHYENRLINVNGGTATGTHDDLWTPDWKTASFENSWANAGGNYSVARFFKDRNGIVHLFGNITGGSTTPGNTIMHLGAGYGPTTLHYFPIYCQDGSSVESTGYVYLHQGGDDIIVDNLATNNRCSLDGISWYAGQ